MGFSPWVFGVCSPKPCEARWSLLLWAPHFCQLALGSSIWVCRIYTFYVWDCSIHWGWRGFADIFLWAWFLWVRVPLMLCCWVAVYCHFTSVVTSGLVPGSELLYGVYPISLAIRCVSWSKMISWFFMFSRCCCRMYRFLRYPLQFHCQIMYFQHEAVAGISGHLYSWSCGCMVYVILW